MSAEWKTAVAELEKAGILTAAAPGSFAGKEGKHVPTIAAADGKVTITVPHGMADDHLIEYVYAKNGAGEVVAIVKLTATDAPTLTFDYTGDDIVAFEYCNQHGVWSSA